jgi:hypothetical protein
MDKIANHSGNKSHESGNTYSTQDVPGEVKNVSLRCMSGGNADE